MQLNNTYESVVAQDVRHHIRPFTDLSDPGKGMIIFSSAKGAYVYDTNGHELIDGIGGLWCVNIGHGRQEMAGAIAEQITKLTFYSSFVNFSNPIAAEFAERLSAHTPGDLNHVFFSSGGSCANETAVRIVHHYFNRLGKTEKKAIITRDRAYHGSTLLTASLSRSSDHTGWDILHDSIHVISCPDTYRRPDGMTVEDFCDVAVSELEEKIATLGPDNVACFIAEPIMGAGGVIMPPPGYHKRTLDVCRKYDVLYISDEVVTGFGRLGHVFASEAEFEILPDLLVSAKGISSGYVPLGATFVSDKIFDVLRKPGGGFLHGFTYTAHPVACAAGLKNLEIIEREEICQHVRETGRLFQTLLEGLSDLGIVGNVRGSHFMMGIEFVQDRRSKERFDPNLLVSGRIADLCYERGLVVRPILPELILLSPTLVLSTEEIRRIERILRDSIKQTMNELVANGHWRG